MRRSDHRAHLACFPSPRVTTLYPLPSEVWTLFIPLGGSLFKVGGQIQSDCDQKQKSPEGCFKATENKEKGTKWRLRAESTKYVVNKHLLGQREPAADLSQFQFFYWEKQPCLEQGRKETRSHTVPWEFLNTTASLLRLVGQDHKEKMRES